MIRGLLRLSVGHIQCDALTFVVFTKRLKKKKKKKQLKIECDVPHLCYFIPSLVVIFKTPNKLMEIFLNKNFAEQSFFFFKVNSN